MNLLKRSSPLTRQGQTSPLYSGRLTPSPHFGTTPGSPISTNNPQRMQSLLLQMGGENSAFKALVPNPNFGGLNISGGYASDSDEEINVNDESDCEVGRNGVHSRSCSPVVVTEESKDGNQPLQLTKHDRD